MFIMPVTWRKSTQYGKESVLLSPLGIAVLVLITPSTGLLLNL
jgi:hypothetical protein